MKFLASFKAWFWRQGQFVQGIVGLLAVGGFPLLFCCCGLPVISRYMPKQPGSDPVKRTVAHEDDWTYFKSTYGEPDELRFGKDGAYKLGIYRKEHLTITFVETGKATEFETYKTIPDDDRDYAPISRDEAERLLSGRKR